MFRIRQVPHSNLGPETGYPHWGGGSTHLWNVGQHQRDYTTLALTMEAVRTSGTSVNFNMSTHPRKLHTVFSYCPETSGHFHFRSRTSRFYAKICLNVWNYIYSYGNTAHTWTMFSSVMRFLADPSGRFVAGVAVSNSARSMNVCVLCFYMLCCPAWVEVSATSWSLVQRSPTVGLCYVCDQETPKGEAKGPSWTISACEWN
jgi:hypothetical protein